MKKLIIRNIENTGAPLYLSDDFWSNEIVELPVSVLNVKGVLLAVFSRTWDEIVMESIPEIIAKHISRISNNIKITDDFREEDINNLCLIKPEKSSAIRKAKAMRRSIAGVFNE